MTRRLAPWMDLFARARMVWKFGLFLLAGIAWFVFIESLENVTLADWAHGHGFGWPALVSSTVVLSTLAYLLIAPARRRAELAESRLTDLEARGRMVLANTSDAVLVHDLTGRLLDVNDQACQLLGYDREELLGMGIADIAVDIGHRDREALWRDMPLEETVVLTSVHRPRSGELIPVELRLLKRIEAGGPVVIALARSMGGRIQAALRTLIEGTANVTGQAFFDTLAEMLPRVFAVRHAWIGRIDRQDPGLVHALAVWNGREVVGADYRLAGTPCEAALGMTACFHPSGLRRLYRRAGPFPIGRATSYFGIPLREAGGRAVGVLALMDDRVMEEEPGRLIILNILAGRVVAEIDRLDAEAALAASEEKYRRLMESAHDAIIAADADTGIIVSANRQAGRLLGRPVEAIVGMHQRALHPAEEGERYAGIFREHGAQGGVAHDLQVVRADGVRVPVDIGSAIVEVGGKRLLLGIFRDMTERLYVEETIRAINATLETRVQERTQQLSQANARLAGIIDTAMDAIVSVNESHVIVLFNPAAERMFMVSQADALGKNLDAFLPEPFRAEHHRQVGEFARGGVTRRGMGHLGHVFALRANGQTFPAEIAISVLETERGRIYTSVIRDISERFEAEQERKLSEERMRRLTGHLQSVREEERARIANEIHDELGGLLTGLKMNISFLAKLLAVEQDDARGKLTELNSLTETAIQTVRKIATDLRPSVLDNLGLLPAIEWQTKELQRRMGIRCQLTMDAPDLELTRDQTTAIFRIVQESLTNVVRHAQASLIRVSVERLEDELIVVVRDNGKGIRQDDVLDINSFGLLGMFERARRYGGSLKIAGRPGEGTVVTLVLPLAAAEAETLAAGRP